MTTTATADQGKDYLKRIKEGGVHDNSRLIGDALYHYLLVEPNESAILEIVSSPQGTENNLIKGIDYMTMLKMIANAIKEGWSNEIIDKLIVLSSRDGIISYDETSDLYSNSISAIILSIAILYQRPQIALPLLSQQTSINDQSNILFFAAILANDVAMLERIVNHFQLTKEEINANQYVAFNLAFSHGKTEMMDWFFEHYYHQQDQMRTVVDDDGNFTDLVIINDGQEEINSLLSSLTLGGVKRVPLASLHWIRDHFHLSLGNPIIYQLINAIKGIVFISGQLDVIELIQHDYEAEAANHPSSSPPLLIEDEKKGAFLFSCQYNHVDLLTWLRRKQGFSSNLYADVYQNGFNVAFLHGNLEVIQWFYHRGGHFRKMIGPNESILPFVKNMVALNKLETLQWLIDNDPDVRSSLLGGGGTMATESDYETVFYRGIVKTALVKGHLHLLDWVFNQTGYASYDVFDNYVFGFIGEIIEANAIGSLEWLEDHGYSFNIPAKSRQQNRRQQQEEQARKLMSSQQAAIDAFRRLGEIKIETVLQLDDYKEAIVKSVIHDPVGVPSLRYFYAKGMRIETGYSKIYYHSTNQILMAGLMKGLDVTDTLNWLTETIDYPLIRLAEVIDEYDRNYRESFIKSATMTLTVVGGEIKMPLVNPRAVLWLAENGISMINRMFIRHFIYLERYYYVNEVGEDWFVRHFIAPRDEELPKFYSRHPSVYLSSSSDRQPSPRWDYWEDSPIMILSPSAVAAIGSESSYPQPTTGLTIENAWVNFLMEVNRLPFHYHRQLELEETIVMATTGNV